MKRISSFFLALMLVIGACMIPIGADGVEPNSNNVGASSNYPLAASRDLTGYTESTVEIEGVTYNVIDSTEDFMGKTLAAGKYIFANDITINFTPESTFQTNDNKGQSVFIAESGAEFYGNGKTLTVNGLVFTQAYSSLFGAPADDKKPYNRESIFKIFDLTIKGDCTFQRESSGVILGIFQRNYGLGNGGTTMKNVHIDMDITAKSTFTGGMIGYLQYYYKNTKYPHAEDFLFENCSVSGSMKGFSSVETSNIGAFIGHAGYNIDTEYLITFRNCSSSMHIQSYGSRVGGYIGYANSSKDGRGLIFENCEFTGSIASSCENAAVGAYVGYAKADSRFTNCLSSGTIYSSSITVGKFEGIRETVADREDGF